MPARVTITDAPNADGKFRYEPRGGSKELIYSHDKACILVGPRDTGKTLSACWKAHLICCKYPKTQGAIVRAIYASMPGSVLQTFDRVVEGNGVVKLGKHFVSRYLYPNGSVIWVGGMDNPGKVLSSERDFIYACQAEALAEEEWGALGSCCTGRSAVIPHPQIFADANPANPQHWIRRHEQEQRLRLIPSRHQDNPDLYDEAGTITPMGQKRLDTLKQVLTGVQYSRLFLGLWSMAEGAVFDNFDSTPGGPHVRERPLSEMAHFMMCQDDGYTDPAVILLVGVDSDRRWHVFREFYETGKTHKVVAEVAAQWCREFNVTKDAVDDAAASLIAELRDRNIPAVGGKGRIIDGCHKVRDRLVVRPDGKSRLTFSPSCKKTINDMESYAHKPGKDEPAHENSHAPAALRYLADQDDTPFQSQVIQRNREPTFLPSRRSRGPII